MVIGVIALAILAVPFYQFYKAGLPRKNLLRLIPVERHESAGEALNKLCSAIWFVKKDEAIEIRDQFIATFEYSGVADALQAFINHEYEAWYKASGAVALVGHELHSPAL
jgi:hypothetical protein